MFTAKNHKRHFIAHDYQDHGRENMMSLDLGKIKIKNTKGGVAIPFPIKLHQVLDEVQQSGLSNIVSWQSHGRAFRIHEPNEFVESILSVYFKQSKIESFQRQLNLYGFKRITRGKDKGAHYHELFLRDKQFLTYQMTRTKVNGTKIRGKSNPDEEPNFYKMSPISFTDSYKRMQGQDLGINIDTESSKDCISNILDHHIAVNRHKNVEKDMINFINDLDDSSLSEAIIFDESIFL